jgi:hypothetical protein
VIPHKALKKGKVKIDFTPSTPGTDESASAHTILIGD